MESPRAYETSVKESAASGLAYLSAYVSSEISQVTLYSLGLMS